MLQAAAALPQARAGAVKILAMMQALAEPKVRERLSDLGLDIASREQQSPEGLTAFHRAEIDKWWPIIKAAGIKVE
jgi:tripartite-type tricarboxylate transporter receptor subunit TctC